MMDDSSPVQLTSEKRNAEEKGEWEGSAVWKMKRDRYKHLFSDDSSKMESYQYMNIP